MHTKASIRGKNIKEPLIKSAQSTKQASLRCSMQGIETVLIMVTFIKQKASKTSAKGSRNFKLGHRIE